MRHQILIKVLIQISELSLSSRGVELTVVGIRWRVREDELVHVILMDLLLQSHPLVLFNQLHRQLSVTTKTYGSV